MMNETEEKTQASLQQGDLEGGEEVLSADPILQMREVAVRRILYIVAALGLPLLIGGSYAVWLQGKTELIYTYVAVYLVVAVTAFLPRIPYQVRAAIVAFAAYFIGLYDLITVSWEEDMRAFFVVFPALVALFFGQRWGVAAIGLVILSLLFPGQLLASYLDPTLWDPNMRAMRTGGMIVVVVMSFILVSSESVLIEHLRRALRAMSERAASLRRMQDDLDQQVESMRKLNYTVQRRVMHLEAGAQVAQELGSIFDPDLLLERAAFLISSSFGFYHTGIFLVDETEEWAVLRAASSEGGRQMLEHGHRLRRGEGMVGWVLVHRQPRVALDVGKDAVHFANPFLPATRSELALPLMVGNRLIGVLDVQSTEEAAFDQDDVRALTFLAAQLAVALDNAIRLRGEAEQLEATSAFYRMVRRLSAATTAHDVYEAVMTTLAEYDPTQAILYLRRRSEGRLQVVAQFQGGETYFPRQEQAQEGMASLFHHLFDLRQPFFFESPEEAKEDAVFHAEWERLELGNDGALAFIPIAVDEEHDAMLYLLYQRRHHFTPLERRLYIAIADMAGTALARAFLLQEVEETARRERWLQAFTEELMSLFEVPLLAQNAGTILLQRVGARGVRVEIAPQLLGEQEESA